MDRKILFGTFSQTSVNVGRVWLNYLSLSIIIRPNVMYDFYKEEKNRLNFLARVMIDAGENDTYSLCGRFRLSCKVNKIHQIIYYASIVKI